jgi:predicted anti-sigma-YlaC factor YlaD
MPLIFPERRNWKQLLVFTIQYALGFVGLMSIIKQCFQWDFLFVGVIMGVGLGILPHFRRSNIPKLRPPVLPPDEI